MRNRFPGATFKKNYWDIKTMGEFWGWVDGPLMTGLYPQSWYNNLTLTKEQRRYVGRDNLLLGAVEIRQMRVKYNSCSERLRQQFCCDADYGDGGAAVETSTKGKDGKRTNTCRLNTTQDPDGYFLGGGDKNCFKYVDNDYNPKEADKLPCYSEFRTETTWGGKATEEQGPFNASKSVTYQYTGYDGEGKWQENRDSQDSKNTDIDGKLHSPSHVYGKHGHDTSAVLGTIDYGVGG